ncbi:winged helix-turn-helix transcriptional regulator [Psychromonas sp. PT13]|uniref:winged helix-turn-helix transcriptional regulator n=1 Tax=Psychromonas sp. PT13 TaxID=3439547 RepID=UPI003EBB7044
MQNFPYPGKPVRGSTTGKPTMALFDLLGRRWAMGVIWQLNLCGPCTFRELQSRCETISPAVLNARIKELREALLLERCEQGYQVSELGKQLTTLLSPFPEFSEKWAESLASLDKTTEPNNECD